MEYVNEKNTRFKAARSSGPGGQRVNKKETKVQVWVKIDDLPLQTQEKDLLREKLENRINKDDELEISSEEERFQEQNHKRALERMNEIIAEALIVSPPRIPTEPHENIEEKFREERRLQGLKKKYRKESKTPPIEELSE